MLYRQLIEFYEKGFRSLFMLEFQHDQDMDWYEVRVYSGSSLVGYVHGYANQGWNPQVNNIWVTEALRRRGLGTIMMAKVEDYSGQLPEPATPIDDNEPAQAFWAKFRADRVASPRETDGETGIVGSLRKVEYNQFIEVREEGFVTLFMMEFSYQKDSDWFEVAIHRGKERVAWVEGYGNEGWHPQVNDLRVDDRYRRKGLGTLMLAKVEQYFGFRPLPTSRIDDDPSIQAFWDNYSANVAGTEPPAQSRDLTGGKEKVRLNQFIEIHDEGRTTRFKTDLLVDRETDWFEIKVFLGDESVGMCDGYANEGWHPQVNRIWVEEEYRRRGIGSLMIAKLEDYFGFKPLPTSTLDYDEPHGRFWKSLLEPTTDSK